MAKRDNLKIFISYSHKDMKYKKELLSHLESLNLTHNIDVWHDGKILAGDSIDSEVLIQLSKSDIVLLLVSTNFLASCYCINTELQKAIERHNKNECIVVPVILSESIIDNSLSFAGLLRVPEDGKPIQKFKPQNNGYVNAVAKIKQMIDAKFIDTRKSSVQEPASPIYINLYQHGKELPYVIDDNTWNVIQTLRDRILDFQRIMNEKTIDFILQYKNEFTKNKKSLNLTTFRQNQLKSFLLDISLSTREWLFKDTGVRVHFRVLNKSKESYVGFVVVDGKAKSDVKINWARKITAMSTTSGMIYYSGELNAPLIKSKNEEFHETGKHDDIYVDYITAALKFKGKYDTANPLMSMGISIEKEFNKKYAPYLVALSFYRFDIIVENLITLVCTKISAIDKDFELSTIIE
ncbi:MAG: toll/interleukin-1 receptor domain-containing protein [Ruminococcus sp.]|nr:toll/interleukin-1 receptor domain-containing protein [Ruminococcus sp.]